MIPAMPNTITKVIRATCMWWFLFSSLITSLSLKAWDSSYYSTLWTKVDSSSSQKEELLAGALSSRAAQTFIMSLPLAELFLR